MNIKLNGRGCFLQVTWYYTFYLSLTIIFCWYITTYLSIKVTFSIMAFITLGSKINVITDRTFIMLGFKMLRMGLLQCLGPNVIAVGTLITIGSSSYTVPSTAVGFCLSLSSWNSTFINRPEKGRTTGLLPTPLCYSEIFQKRADWLIINFLVLKCMSH